MKGLIHILAAVAVAASASAAAAQTRINVDKPRVNVGDVNSNSTSRAEQRVTGVDANVQTYFEASDIPSKTKTTVKNVPDAVAPSIVGGNPCMVSASIGGSGVGFGFGVGLGVEDEGCETRQVVALMSNMGDRQAAFLHLCMHNAQVFETVKAAGFATCQAYAGIITPGTARVPNAAVVSQVSTPGAATPPVLIQTRASTAATSITMAQADSRDCGDKEYRSLQGRGAAWSEYSPACQARHAGN